MSTPARATDRCCARGSRPIEASPRTRSHRTFERSSYANVSTANQGKKHSEPSSKPHSDSPTITYPRAPGKNTPLIMSTLWPNERPWNMQENGEHGFRRQNGSSRIRATHPHPIGRGPTVVATKWSGFHGNGSFTGSGMPASRFFSVGGLVGNERPIWLFRYCRISDPTRRSARRDRRSRRNGGPPTHRSNRSRIRLPTVSVIS